GYERAKSILAEHRDVLERLALVLLDRESMDGKEVYALIEEMTGQHLGPKPTEKKDERSGKETGSEPEPGVAKAPPSRDLPPDEVEVAAAHRSSPAGHLPSTE
ncbi:MAG: hypothetical protein V3R89_08300, partial [Thermoanaerobaculia bacterium]